MNTKDNQSIESSTPSAKRSADKQDTDTEAENETKDYMTKKVKLEEQVTTEDDPAPTGSLTINDQLFDDYNEESDQDWASAGLSNDESDSEASLIDQGILSHPAFHVDDDSLADVDVDGTDEESQFQLAWEPYTDEEKEQLQEEAREKGLMKFIEKYLIQQSVPVPKMLEVFNIYMHPKAAALASDIELLPILKSVITRFLRKRRRLEHINTLEDVAKLFKEAHNIMIVTGAGVSVSCGIPDFRSETGIYSRLQEYELDDPQQMFDIDYFRESPEIFYSFAKELYPANYQPSPSHLFVKLIEDKGKLLRNYTQNIDTLEHKANIKRVVNCHGSFATATCVTCGYKVDGTEIESYIMAQQIPPCPKCSSKKLEKEGTKSTKGNNKSKEEEEDDDNDDQPYHHQKGVSIIKPDITFFGERLPAEFDNLLAIDTEQVDLLIVIGFIAQRDCDVIVPELCRMLNWDLRHSKLPGGSALSVESRESSVDKDGNKVWKYVRDGLYTFPGAVTDPQFINNQRLI
ncbi:DHS-like NAD/FAD-binding domain-containing protein [Cokeromyces recurvatus]|uniref:DHS-like NAD/FAD-binding domain-containing protein n=1 Tax=Cokeromyces recurvatus TaxID=90255 RepID=UPI00222048D5|nr:DHS-like NAD/FAD-binding domain-containing protein [Cokeromyces recurvatus]KAI7899142.1 DHS-like NAD/FAD-binding domain-containing protein [Cokeromyces recurvatus]